MNGLELTNFLKKNNITMAMMSIIEAASVRRRIAIVVLSNVCYFVTICSIISHYINRRIINCLFCVLTYIFYCQI